MSKIIRTQKPSVLPFYAMALVFLGLCAVLPVYKLWALLAALGGALIAFGAAQKVCPPRVVEHEVPFHTGVEDVDAMLTDIQQKLDTLHTLNEQLPDPQLSAAMTRMEKAGRSIVEAVEANPEKAKRLFERYNRCRKAIYRRVEPGDSIIRVFCGAHSEYVSKEACRYA